jgi:DNA-binding NarL/FixJ family response regulator
MTRAPRIVILDDEPFVSECIKMLVRFYFNDAGILTFTDAEEALQELMREDPDLFTTDFNHPKIPCDEILRLLAARKVKYPIFVISAWAEWLKPEKLLDEFVDQGLNVSLLSKPFTLEQLRALLLKHLGPGDNPRRKILKNTP